LQIGIVRISEDWFLLGSINCFIAAKNYCKNRSKNSSFKREKSFSYSYRYCSKN